MKYIAIIAFVIMTTAAAFAGKLGKHTANYVISMAHELNNSNVLVYATNIVPSIQPVEHGDRVMYVVNTWDDGPGGQIAVSVPKKEAERFVKRIGIISVVSQGKFIKPKKLSGILRENPSSRWVIEYKR